MRGERARERRGDSAEPWRVEDAVRGPDVRAVCDGDSAAVEGGRRRGEVHRRPDRGEIEILIVAVRRETEEGREKDQQCDRSGATHHPILAEGGEM